MRSGAVLPSERIQAEHDSHRRKKCVEGDGAKKENIELAEKWKLGPEETGVKDFQGHVHRLFIGHRDGEISSEPT